MKLFVIIAVCIFISGCGNNPLILFPDMQQDPDHPIQIALTIDNITVVDDIRKGTCKIVITNTSDRTITMNPQVPRERIAGPILHRCVIDAGDVHPMPALIYDQGASLVFHPGDELVEVFTLDISGPETRAYVVEFCISGSDIDCVFSNIVTLTF
jgi:hypothetical protein